MLDKVLKTIRQFQMVSPGDRVLVGVSGGADSLALLHILSQLKYELSIELFVVHVHHGLRGLDADKDAEFVASIAGEWGIPFFLKKVDIAALAQEWGMTEEEAGRKVRYSFFYEILEKVDGHKIALAHHRDDQAETILHHILRGTGLQGLQGMKPVRDQLIIRPLIEVSRKDIEAYCRDNGLEFRVDATNQETYYTRNRIRHLLIPYIEKNFNPNFVEALVRMGDIIREEEGFLSMYCSKLFDGIAKVDESKVRFPIEAFNGLPAAIKRRMLRIGMEVLLKDLAGIQYSHIDSVIEMAGNGQTGSAADLPHGLRVEKGYNFLVISFKASGEEASIVPFEYPLDVPGKVYIKELGVEISIREVEKAGALNRGQWCVYVDRCAVKGNLTVRNRRNGDRFKPLGMRGTKKLKDYLIDKKVPRKERGCIPLVVDGKDIVWVVGYQINDNYKVTPATKHILELKLGYKKERRYKDESDRQSTNR